MAIKLPDFGKFLVKHGGELLSLTGIFRNILPALPIGSQDKDKVLGTLSDLEAAAQRIISSAAGVSNVTVKASDVRAAVAAILPDLVKAEVAAQVAALPKPAAEPGA